MKVPTLLILVGVVVSYCYADGNPCVCEPHWDDSTYRASCANQQGCTDCDKSGHTWCHPTDNECDTVERDGSGYSESWFKCDKDKAIHHSEDSYTKIEIKRCSDFYGSYKTVAEAKKACELDDKCEAIFERDCGGTDGIYLCPIGSTYLHDIHSCLHQKGPVKDHNDFAKKICKKSCENLVDKCGQLLGCGGNKFDVTKYCPVTCSNTGWEILREDATCQFKKAPLKTDQTFDACAKYCETNEATILLYIKPNDCSCCYNPPGKVVDGENGSRMYKKRAATAQAGTTAAATTAAVCHDTPHWDDGSGRSCEIYTKKGWCGNNAIIPPKEGGSKWNYPEGNCCSCGKYEIWDTLAKGDIVILHPSESAVKQSLEEVGYVWVDEMRSMLGARLWVIDILEGNIIALPSPDNKSKDGKLYFPRSIVFKDRDSSLNYEEYAKNMKYATGDYNIRQNQQESSGDYFTTDNNNGRYQGLAGK